MMKTNPRKAYKAAIKMSGSFHGKSNALGQGGRAAQLKARGVPGGVIGNLARAAHAAPGQANYHKKSKKRKVAPLQKEELGMAMKRSHKKAEQHIHVHVHMKGSPMLQGQKQEHKEQAKVFKKARKGGFGDEKDDTKLEHQEEEAHGFKKSKHMKSAHKCKGAMCKHSEHMKAAKKKSHK